MALSDEILASGDKMARLRSRLEELAAESGATAAFCVDEEGNPFATVGHVEFRLPFPLSGLLEETETEPILGALVGEPEFRESSRYLVQRLNERALVVLVLEAPARAERLEALRAKASELARHL